MWLMQCATSCHHVCMQGNQGCPRLVSIYVLGLLHCRSVCVDSLKLENRGDVS